MRKLQSSIVVAGKRYPVEVRNGIRYIEDKTVEEFLNTLPDASVADFAVVGTVALSLPPQPAGVYQRVLNRLDSSRRN